MAREEESQAVFSAGDVKLVKLVLVRFVSGAITLFFSDTTLLLPRITEYTDALNHNENIKGFRCTQQKYCFIADNISIKRHFQDTDLGDNCHKNQNHRYILNLVLTGNTVKKAV